MFESTVRTELEEEIVPGQARALVLKNGAFLLTKGSDHRQCGRM